ncbi:hypothetical protein ONZ45_g6113 [Pleurotus djamor]|nr:hypothetical protein ONZ45_g6113 [Pleurotus djamor]
MALPRTAPESSTTVTDDEAGLRPWPVLIGGILATIVSAGYPNSFGVYEDLYTRLHTASASNVGWIGSTQMFLGFAVGLPAGRLLDKGYFRQTVLAGSLIFLASLFSLSLAHPEKYYQLWLSQGLGMGLGAGLIYAPTVVIQGHHWGRRKLFAMTVVALGNPAGGAIFPIMLNRLFNGSAGFAKGVRASAYLCLGLLVVSNLLMKDNPALKRKRNVQHPTDSGILADFPFWVFTVGLLCFTCGLLFPQLFAINHGIEPDVAFYLLAIFNATGTVSRATAGFLAHHFGPFNVIIVALFCAIGLTFSLLGVRAYSS